jgi:zinc-ribbon domain
VSAVRTAGAAFCPRCGEERPQGAHFCPRCGLDLAEIELPAGVSPPAATPVGGTAVQVPAPPLPAPRVPATPQPQLAPPWQPPPGAPGTAGPVPAAAPFADPSAVGRRASGAGWVVVVVAALAFLAASLALIAAGGGLGGQAPLATWDRILTTPTSVAEGEPFDIEAQAGNGAAEPTGLVWLVIDWRPDDRAFDPDAVWRFGACVPADCRFRDDEAGGRTVVSWAGLAAGERQAFVVTVELTGIDGGTTVHYGVTTGTGADEASLAGGKRWSLDLEVRQP